VGAVTPGIHLRWLPGARVEFPYRERTLGVVLEVVGTVCRWMISASAVLHAGSARPSGKDSGGVAARPGAWFGGGAFG
jgi:hypothetical protein